MLEVLNASEKYMLYELMEQVTTFVLEHLNETNCLEVFNASHLLSCTKINEQCLKLFQNNPMKFIEDNNFVELRLSALHMFVKLPKMNCTGSDLKRAVYSWCGANGYCTAIEDANENAFLQCCGLVAADFIGKQFYSVTCEGNQTMVLKKFRYNDVKFPVLRDRWLLGVGLCTGVCGSLKNELVKLTISQQNEVIWIEERKIEQSEKVSILEIMFKNTNIIKKRGMLLIKVEFETEELRFASTYSVCVDPHNSRCDYSGYYYHDHNKKNKCEKKMIAGDRASPFSSLAYLIYAAS
jgi:BTB And C-terminal Kelch